MGPMIENSKFELGEKLNHQIKVKLHGKSNGDSLDAVRRCLDPKIAHRGLIGAKIKDLKSELGEKLDH